MSEVTVKNYVLTKTTPNDVLFIVSPLSNPTVKKKVHLTKRAPKISLPQDYALGIFFDTELFNMYKKGLFTFNDNEGLAKAAQAAGVYFDETLDFTPAKETDVNSIIKAIRTANRAEILKAIGVYGRDRVKEVVIANVDDLSVAVVKMLEGILNIQLTMNEQ